MSSIALKVRIYSTLCAKVFIIHCYPFYFLGVCACAWSPYLKTDVHIFVKCWGARKQKNMHGSLCFLSFSSAHRLDRCRSCYAHARVYMYIYEKFSSPDFNPQRVNNSMNILIQCCKSMFTLWQFVLVLNKVQDPRYMCVYLYLRMYVCILSCWYELIRCSWQCWRLVSM